MNHVDARQQSAAETSQSDRGWDFRPVDENPSHRPYFLIAGAAMVLIGFCFIASVQ